MLSGVLEPIERFLSTSFLEWLQTSPEKAIALLITAPQSTLSGVGNLISLVFAIFITLTFAIYMISDVSWLEKGLRATIPSAHRGDSDYLSREFVFIWKAHIRGQLRIMLVLGVLVTIVTFILGLAYALGLGFIAGVLVKAPRLAASLSGGPEHNCFIIFQGNVRLVSLSTIN